MIHWPNAMRSWHRSGFELANLVSDDVTRELELTIE